MIAKENINELQRELKLIKETYEDIKKSPPKDARDLASQTDNKGISEKKDGSCQTDTPDRKDFQVQTNGQKQAKPIATQTDSSSKCDFQSQVNISREGNSVAVQTIKEEVAMPNIPNSAAPIPPKKRKLSSTSSATSPILGPSTRNGQATTRPSVGNNLASQSNWNGSGALDEAILNSEVYKIYCRNEDPTEAIKQIRELKTCIYFYQATEAILAEDALKRESEKTLNELWKSEPDESKFIKIKKYVNSEDGKIHVFNLNKKMNHAFNRRFTIIKMLLPNGYEFWYVSNIEGGPTLSKWYRAESTSPSGGNLLAQLYVMGITDATIKKLSHNLERGATKTSWLNFAYGVLNGNLGSLFPSYRNPSFIFDSVAAKNEKTKVVNATLRLTHRDRHSPSRKTFKTYHGKSTRHLEKTQRPDQENEDKEMKIEAKKAAMIEFFKERFGFTEFKNLYVDELHRSLDI